MNDIDNFQQHMQITKKALLAYQVPDSDEKDDTYTMKNSISRALVMTGYTLLAALALIGYLLIVSAMVILMIPILLIRFILNNAGNLLILSLSILVGMLIYKLL